MLDRFRKQWHVFRADPAGERFQRRYRRNTARSGFARKTIVIGAGFAVLLIGIVLLVLPGPGLVLMLLGGGLMAEESLIVARCLDKLDVAFQRARARWWRTT